MSGFMLFGVYVLLTLLAVVILALAGTAGICFIIDRMEENERKKD